MRSKTPELWRSLKIGDRIRLVEMPPEFLRPGYVIFPETLGVYRKLVDRGRPLRVREIDEHGQPWILCRFRRHDGSWEEHSLAVNHDGIVRVQRRK